MCEFGAFCGYAGLEAGLGGGAGAGGEDGVACGWMGHGGCPGVLFVSVEGCSSFQVGGCCWWGQVHMSQLKSRTKLVKCRRIYPMIAPRKGLTRIGTCQHWPINFKFTPSDRSLLLRL
jgi:hypothetical protein